MKKVLVIGGNGFLGSILSEVLLNRNYDVTIADLHNSRTSNKFIKCDISKDEDIDLIFNNHYDIVYNLAGIANLDEAIENPIKTMELNFVSNIKIIQKCIDNSVDKFVYASSAYAMSEKGSFYGISKLASEKVIEEYNKKHNLNYIIIRYGSVYSERNFNNNYIYNLIKSAIEQKTINHAGDGEEIREYIHANDAAELSVDVIENNDYLNKHIVLTGSQAIKRKDLFDMINEVLGGDLIIKYDTKSNSNHYKLTPYSFQASISKKLTPNPQIDLGQGILECIRAVHENN